MCHEHFGRDFYTQEVTRDRQRGMPSSLDKAGAAGCFQTHTTDQTTAGEHHSKIALLLLSTELMLCFFTSGRVLGKQQKSPSSKPQHFCIIISLEKLTSCFEPLSRRASSPPCDAFTLTASWADGSVSLPRDRWPQRALGLAGTLAACSGRGHLPLRPCSPLRLVAVERRVATVLGPPGRESLPPRTAAGDTAYVSLNVQIQLLFIALFFKESLQYIQRLREFPLFFSPSLSSPPASAVGHTHCVVLT